MPDTVRQRALILAAIYLVVLLTLTLAPLDGWDRASRVDFHLRPLATIRMALARGPGTHEFAVAIGNLIAFVPVGVLLPILAGRRSLVMVLAGGALLSVAIEVAQYSMSFALGFGYRTADVDDVILNTIGSTLGYFALLAAIAIRTLAASRRPARPGSS